MSDDYPGTRSGKDVVYDYAERVGHVVYPRPEALERDLSDLGRGNDLGDTPAPERAAEGVPPDPHRGGC